MSRNLIVSIFVLALGLSFVLVPVGDPDLGWHLLGGEYVSTRGEVPTKDFINAYNLEWVDYHWFAQFLIYKIYSIGGFDLLRATVGVLVSGILYLLVLTARTVCLEHPAASIVELVILNLSALLLSSVISIRPQLFALLGLSIALLVLLRRLKLELPILLSISVISVNMHVFWVFIPFFWLILRLLPRFLGRTDSPTAVYAWSGLILLSLCGFVSPYTSKNYLVLWDYLHLQPAVRSTVAEFRSSLLLDGPQSWVMLVILVLVARNWKSSPLPLLALHLSGYVLAISGAKFLGALVIMGAPSISHTLLPWLGALDRAKFRQAWGVVIAITLCTTSWMILRLPRWQEGGFKYIYKNYPVQACRYLTQGNASVNKTRRVLTHFNDGGWCAWSIGQAGMLERFRVTHDGRTQFVPDQHYTDLFSTLSLKLGWEDRLRLFNADFLVLPKKAALANISAFIPEWKLIRSLGGFQVYTKTFATEAR